MQRVAAQVDGAALPRRQRLDPAGGDALRPDGALLLHRMGAVAISGLDTYTQPDAGVSFRAASVDTPTTPL